MNYLQHRINLKEIMLKLVFINLTHVSSLKIYWLKIWLIIKLDLQHSVLHLGRLKSLLFLRLYHPVVFLGSSSWSLWDSSSLIAAKVFNEMTSLLSWSVDRPDSLRAAVYESSGYITFIASFCSLSRSSLRYDGSARWKTGHAYSSIDLMQVT